MLTVRGDEEFSALFSLKARFEPVRAMITSEENLVLDLKPAEEPAVSEPAIETENLVGV